MNKLLYACLLFSLCHAFALTPKEQLGKLLFTDTNLSQPPDTIPPSPGQSCESCHRDGLSDPDPGPVSEGVVGGRFGFRNAPTARYAVQNGPFNTTGPTSGGQFWDGRAADLVVQAKLPFVNPVEMNNASFIDVVGKVMNAEYAPLFEQVYGPGAFDDFSVAFNNIADAIAAFEMSSEMNRFDSKFDFVNLGLAEFTPQEANGLALFNGRAKCKSCHTSRSFENIGLPITNFSDEQFRNLGLPRNDLIPANADPGFIDLGLGMITGNNREMGEFKTPTLRNVALTAPYMHNGIFNTLKEVVHFYNARDVDPLIAPPEFAQTMDNTIGNLGLTDQEEDDLVAFLKTLTDGFNPLVP